MAKQRFKCCARHVSIWWPFLWKRFKIRLQITKLWAGHKFGTYGRTDWRTDVPLVDYMRPRIFSRSIKSRYVGWHKMQTGDKALLTSGGSTDDVRHNIIRPRYEWDIFQWIKIRTNVTRDASFFPCFRFLKHINRKTYLIKLWVMFTPACSVLKIF